MHLDVFGRHALHQYGDTTLFHSKNAAKANAAKGFFPGGAS